jgi:hypothetical protein
MSKARPKLDPKSKDPKKQPPKHGGGAGSGRPDVPCGVVRNVPGRVNHPNSR